MKGKPDINIGVFTVSAPEYDPFEALDVFARLGYTGVEWRVIQDPGDKSKPSFWSGNRTSMSAEELIEKAPELKKKARSLGLAMPSLGAYVDCSHLGVVELHMKAAVAIGAKSLRIGPGAYNREQGRYRDLFKKARAQYAKVAKLAARYRVRALIETHMGLLTPSVASAVAVLQGLDPAHVGIMWDPANGVTEGAETCAMAVDLAGDYLAEVHVKNVRAESRREADGRTLWCYKSCPPDVGIVNWPAVVAELKKAKFKGWFFMEDFSTEQPLRERLEHDIRWFRRVLD